MIEHIVTNCPVAMRLDRYLRLINPTLTQGVIEQAIRQKHIRLNRVKCKSSDRLKDNDIIILMPYLIPNLIAYEEKILPVGAKSLADKIIKELLLYEHQEFIAINKPAGIATQGGSNINLSIDDALNYLNAQNRTNIVTDGLRLVHRLDRETSGILLIAKNKVSAAKLTNAFKERLIQKEYLAIVTGYLNLKKGKIISKLTKDVQNRKQIVAAEGIEAITEYEVINSNEKHSAILFKPLTGRMHQLRLHSLELGCPIVGDSKYNPIENIGNLLLHAHRLILPALLFDKEIKIEVKVPNYFNKYKLL